MPCTQTCLHEGRTGAIHKQNYSKEKWRKSQLPWRLLTDLEKPQPCTPWGWVQGQRKVFSWKRTLGCGKHKKRKGQKAMKKAEPRGKKQQQKTTKQISKCLNNPHWLYFKDFFAVTSLIYSTIANMWQLSATATFIKLKVTDNCTKLLSRMVTIIIPSLKDCLLVA